MFCRFVCGFFIFDKKKIDSSEFFVRKPSARKGWCMSQLAVSIKKVLRKVFKRITRCLHTFYWCILCYGSCRSWSGWWWWSSSCCRCASCCGERLRKLHKRMNVACYSVTRTESVLKIKRMFDISGMRWDEKINLFSFV